MTTFKQLLDQMTSMERVKWLFGKLSGENTVADLKRGETSEFLDTIVCKIKADGTVCLINRLDLWEAWHVQLCDGRYVFYYVYPDSSVLYFNSIDDLKQDPKEWGFFKLAVMEGWYLIDGEQYFDTRKEKEAFGKWCESNGLEHRSNDKFAFLQEYCRSHPARGK